MVERGALAIYALMKSHDPTPTEGETWENIYPDARDNLRTIVRTVIEAMREPSEGMLEAGAKQRVTIQIGNQAMSGAIGEWPARNAYSAMIDEALSGSPKSDSEGGR
jgi:hypothetical protein